jgi:AbrB family looped-hinge helix DNA binding protein
MTVSTISSKGQITLPASLRRKLGIKPHDRVRVELGDQAILVKPAPDLFVLEGFLGKALPVAVERARMRKAVAARMKSARR